MKSVSATLLPSILLFMMIVPSVLQAHALPPGPHLATIGVGSVEAKPDMAVVQLIASVKAAKAITAKAQLDKQTNDYFSCLQQHGIDKKDIYATHLKIYEERPYSTDRTKKLQYRAVRPITITLYKLQKLQSIIETALKMGIQEVQRIELKISNEEPYRAAARTMAIKEATDKAHAIAQGFNSKLGLIYSVHYHTPQTQPTLYTPVLAKTAVADDLSKHYHQMVRFSDQIEVVFDLQR